MGFIARRVRASGSSSNASPSERGGCGWRKVAITSPTARSSCAVVRSTPSMVTPIATRFTVPNRFTSTGMSLGMPSAFTGRSKITAGPPSAIRRVWISVISSTVETGSRTRTNSPAASSLAMKSRRER